MKKIKSVLWGIPIGFINGFFGSGGGVIAVLVLKRFLEVEERKAHATALSIILPLSCASLLMYGSKTEVDWSIVILCAVGGCVGGLLGARFLNKIPKKWLKIGFGAVMIISGMRLVML